MTTLTQLRTGQLQGTQRLDISCNLTEFPREIFDLADSLHTLNLSGNALAHLPDDLPRLHQLRVLFCSENQFTELPAVLGQCPQLQMVGFKSNRISHVPAAALPPQLRWLILTDNHIATLPDALGHCTQLQKLMLAGNRLTQLPDTLAACHRLELLRISANRLTALPPWLLNLPRLAWLAYGGNPFSEAFETAHQPSESSNPPTTVQWQHLTLQHLLGEGASGVIHQALWQPNPATAPEQVAIKLFKGAVTSDGWPLSELAACLSAGAHPGLIPTTGVLVGHPGGAAGLVMPCIPPHFTTLAGPPSLESCTRDVYAPHTRFSLATVMRIALSAASAAQHLHAQGLLHGDLYAHNLQCTAQGDCVLGDMGAASFLPMHDLATSQALQRLEVRALGCLLEELLAHGEACVDDSDACFALRHLCVQCLHSDVAARPLFGQVVAQLQALKSQKYNPQREAARFLPGFKVLK